MKKEELKKFYIQEGEYWIGYYIVAKNINVALEILKKEEEIEQDVMKEECYICKEVDMNEGNIMLEENEFEAVDNYAE